MYIVISHMHGASYTSFSYHWHWEDCTTAVQWSMQVGRKWHMGQFW